MEQKSKKIDVKIIVIIAITIIAIVEGIVIFTSNNSNNGIKLNTSNYTDYMTRGGIVTNIIEGKYNIVFSINGLSQNYDYSNIEIEVLITSKEYKINEIKKVKCKVNGNASIETGITYNPYTSEDNAKKDLKAEIKSINGTLKPIN